MSTTNRAFIKAYRTDEAQSPPATPTIAGAGGPHAHLVKAAAERATNAVSEASSSDRSAIYGPRPAADSRRTERGVRPRLAAASPERPGSLPKEEGARQPGQKRPLSSFIASTGIARLSSEIAEGDFFKPGTTIASFHWPEVCRTLLRNCGDQLASVADLLVTHADSGRSLVGVLAMSSGAGASTTALCLAARLAERQRRVIVVDGNFRKPGLAKWLEVEPTAGWQDVLKHGAPLTDAVVRATDDRLDLLALNEKIPNDALRLASGLQAVVTAGVLRHAYDHVLLDAGTFADPESQPVLLELMRNMGIDAAIAVTAPNRAKPQDIDALADHLTRSGCEFLGTIANRAAKLQAA